MVGREEIKVAFDVKRKDKESDDGHRSHWYMVMRDTDRQGFGGHIVQRWDHEPTEKEIEAVKFAVRQGVSFITTHIAVSERRYVQVAMPRISMEIVEQEEQ